ncbi:hypothetical protein GYMLUDRAFT_879718 [Collybiopsis luxurians FD-317 M1]|uniref:Uncharacterized protein n=1 Tax=Collybiopsis luxurians FD-317 M1 TaxID=944289 RepID=A0A0D0BKJ6_9AGAR|nr:hypothetical protein GYMLUDRAFT_879718 [Collybiopsis luxurians FD-317 M1]
MFFFLCLIFGFDSCATCCFFVFCFLFPKHVYTYILRSLNLVKNPGFNPNLLISRISIRTYLTYLHSVTFFLLLSSSWSYIREFIQRFVVNSVQLIDF